MQVLIWKGHEGLKVFLKEAYLLYFNIIILIMMNQKFMDGLNKELKNDNKSRFKFRLATCTLVSIF